MDVDCKFLDLNQFELLNKIRKGAFSKVYRVKEISTGKIYAAKVLKFEINEANISSEEISLLLREVNLMSSLNHPSILGFIGFSLSIFRQKPFPTIITNLAANGSLHDILNLEVSGRSPKSWDSTRKLINIYGIAKGLSYLHMHNIIYRDLKPENVLMDEYLFPKISDFWLSKSTKAITQTMNMQSQLGPKGTQCNKVIDKERKIKISKKLDKSNINNFYNRNSFEYMLTVPFKDVFIEDNIYLKYFEDDEEDDDEFLEDINSYDITYIIAFSKETNQKVLCRLLEQYFLKDDSRNFLYDQKKAIFSY